MYCGEGGDDVVLRGTYVAFSKVSSMVVRGYELYFTRGGAVTEESAYLVRGLVVGNEVCNSVVMFAKELKDTTKSFCVRRTRLVRHRF